MKNRKDKDRRYYQKHKAEILLKQKQQRSTEEYRASHRAAERKYRLEHRDTINARLRETHYKKKYGITLEEKRQMYLEQDGNCLGCGKEMLTSRDCQVDHDHATGKIRGLLHRNCNLILGMIYDNPEILISLAHYLLDNKSRKEVIYI